MNINTKFSILAILLISVIGSFLYNYSLQSNVTQSYENFDKTAKELEIIASLKSYYKKDRQAVKEVENILAPVRGKIVSKKENKNNMEISLDKLSPAQTNQIIASFGNSGLQITELILTRVDPHSAKLFIKVVL